MTARTAAYIIQTTLGIQIIYSYAAYALGFIYRPWFSCPAFVIPVTLFAAIEFIFGVYAKWKGDRDLPFSMRTVVVTGIISGFCFFLYGGLYMLGIDIYE